MESHRQSAITVQVEYQSGWWIVVFPSLLFIGVWLAVPALALWVGVGKGWVVLSCLIGVVLAAVIAIVTYPLVQIIAAHGQGTINFTDDTLRWQVGRKQHSIPLHQPYRASLAADSTDPSVPGNVTVEIESKTAWITLHWTNVAPSDVRRWFPAPYFIEETALTPEEGDPGFNLNGNDPSHHAFLEALLTALWRTRNQNRRFQIYARFPWDVPPRPQYTHILVIDRGNPTPAEMDLLACEEQRVFFSVDTLKVSPDYVLDVDTETVCAMPLGFVRAELPGEGARAIYDAKVNLTLAVTFIGHDARGKAIKIDIPLFTDEPEEVIALARYVNWWYNMASQPIENETRSSPAGPRFT